MSLRPLFRSVSVLASSIALLAGAAAAQTGSVPVLELLHDSDEGIPYDMVVQRNALIDPADKRAFTTGGRRRWQHRVDTMERMLDEEKTFPEHLNSVELSSNDEVLYTASERRLYREDISGGPPTPNTPHAVWELRTASEDEILDIRVLPSPDHDRGIYVLTRYNFFVLSYDESTDSLITEDQVGISGALYNHLNFELHRNVAGEYRAYVMGITNTPDQGTTRGLMVCKVGDPLSTPTSHDLEFIVGREGGMWDPRLNLNGQYAYDAGTFNMVVRNIGGTTRGYIACGFDRQVTVLDLMDAGEDPGKWTHELDPGGPGSSTVIDRIVLEQSSPVFSKVRGITWSHDPNFFYVTDRDNLWTVSVNGAPTFPKSSAAHNFGVGEYILQATEVGTPSGPENHVWTLTRGNTRHVLKRFHALNNGSTVLNGEAYGMSTSDGMVALPDPDQPERSVLFATTMGGVVRFDTEDAVEPQRFEVNPSSFQNSSPPGKAPHVTEQIAIGNLSHDPAQPEWNVFTTSGNGFFLAYPVDDERNLSTPMEYQPPVDHPSFVNWNIPGDQLYSTSIEFSDRGANGKWVVYDLINRTRGEISIVAVRLDVSPVFWNCAVADDSSILRKNLWSWQLDLTDNWATVPYEDGALSGADPHNNGLVGGIVVFDLRDLGTTAFDVQEPTYVTCAPLDKIGGAALNGDETYLLATGAHHEEGHLPGNRLSGGVLVFSFDGSTTPPTITRVAERLEEPNPALEGSPNDGFTWSNMNYFDTGYRVRWWDHQGTDTWAMVEYVGGEVYQWSYDPDRAVPLDLDGYWHGREELGGEEWEGYHHEGQDARLYDFGFGPRMLIGQNAETFVLLRPAGLIDQAWRPQTAP